MATTNLQIYNSNARQIKPACVNLFANNNRVDRLEFTMENYNQGNVDLSTMDAYAICYGEKFPQGLDEIKLESEVTSDGLLRIYWDLTLMTLIAPQTISYQIVFKNEGGQQWTSYKAILFCNESLTADEEIVAQYPTILKQMEGRIEDKTDEAVEEIVTGVETQVNNAVTHVNQMADQFDASVVYIPYGETIPVEQRVNNRLYYLYTDEEHTKGRFENSEGVVLSLDPTGYATHVGQTIFSLLPINNAGLHLLDGAKLVGEGIYTNFVDYIANLHNKKDNAISNVTKFGSLTDTNGVLSGFNSTNYATLPNKFSPENKPWEIVISGTFVKTYEDQTFVTSISEYDQGSVYIAMDGMGCFFAELSYDGIGRGAYVCSDSYLEEGKPFWIKVKFTGTEYRLEYSKNGVDYVLEDSCESTTQVYQGEGLALGIYHYDLNLQHEGELNLNECYINIDGQRWWTGTMSSYFVDEPSWQKSVNDYGVCGKFVYDSVANTVRLPKVTGILEGTLDANALGDLVEAGLPAHTHTRGTMNITGSLVNSGADDNGPLSGGTTASGAFTVTKVGNGADGSTTGGYNVYLDASRSWTGSTSTPNYTADINTTSTVQPQTIKGYYYIVVATSTKTDIEVDIDNVVTDLNGKADTDLNNVTDTAKVMISGYSLPSNKFISLSLGTSGTTYTAPANGWITLRKIANSDGSAGAKYCDIYNRTSAIAAHNNGAYSFQLICTIPALKGDTIQINYNATGETILFRFIYAEGNK